LITNEETSVETSATESPTSASQKNETSSGRSAEKSAEINSEDCKDLNEHCALWSNIGHCKWSEKYMSHYCKNSCNRCKSSSNGKEIVQKSSAHPAVQCLDQNLFCGYWARIGECESESKFMKIFCKKSCDLCIEGGGEEKAQEKTLEMAAAYGWYSIT